MTIVFMKGGNFGHRDTDTQGTRPYEDRGRGWIDKSTSKELQGALARVKNQKRQKKRFSLKEQGPADTLTSDF